VSNWVKARWLCWRILYRLGLFGVLYSIVPAWTNYFTFGRFRSLEPSDFVPYVDRVCVPIIRSIKEYERDTGGIPDNDFLNYLASQSTNRSEPPDIQGWDRYHEKLQFRDWNDYDHWITYDFRPGSEGWFVQGHFANGYIPVAPVEIDGAATSATRP
jgi:hypothetical protein